MKPARKLGVAILVALTPLWVGCHQIREAKSRQLTRSALEAFFSQDYDKALEHSEVALRLGSDQPDLRRMRASIFLTRGEPESALKEVDEGLALFESQKRRAKGANGGETTKSDKEGELSEADRSQFLVMRSNALQALDRPEESLTALNDAVKLDPENAGAQNNLAWLLATSTVDKMRDAKLAIEHARKACELTNWKEAGTIDTLAAAYAESGNYKEAERWQREAIAKAAPDEKSDPGFEERRTLYEQGKPYREDPNATYQARLKTENPEAN
ncbi:MAG: tetratricopeptide repeat protein [Verrucomicrobiae bacterium]|nr:tetratricopeptide repeat protein [Verrucomicrobiae bacterium]